MNKRPPLTRNGPDDFQTPPEALWPLLPFLQPDWTIWECACGRGYLVQALRQTGRRVIGTDKDKNFLHWHPARFDCIVTNPPFSLKNEFLERAFALGKPFAFLLPLTALESQRRQNLFRAHGIEVMVFDKRFLFEKPDKTLFHAWFPVAWFCWRLGLPKQLIFATVPKPRKVQILNLPNNGEKTMNDNPENFPNYFDKPRVAPMPDVQPRCDWPKVAPMEGVPAEFDKPHAAVMPGCQAIEPTEDSSLDELGAFALSMFSQFKAQDKKNGEYIWRMGRALELAKKKLDSRNWETWYREKGFTKTWQWQTRTLYRKAPSLEAVVKLGLTEALIKFGVISQKKVRAETQTKTTEESEGDERKRSTVINGRKASKPISDEDDGGDLAEGEEETNDHLAPDGDEEPADDLAEEEKKELKEFQDALRQQTPKTRAMAIQHALELLRDELNEEEVDEELQQTFSQIAELAEEMKGLSKAR